MTFSVAENTWITLRKGDPSFQLQGTLAVTDRAGLQINNSCPSNVANQIITAFERGWIETVATVPKDDPTLFWETLKYE
jgi:hypothetical protein